MICDLIPVLATKNSRQHWALGRNPFGIEERLQLHPIKSYLQPDTITSSGAVWFSERLIHTVASARW